MRGLFACSDLRACSSHFARLMMAPLAASDFTAIPTILSMFPALPLASSSWAAVSQTYGSVGFAFLALLSTLRALS